MPRCKFDRHLRCIDPSDCQNCATFKKIGQQVLLQQKMTETAPTTTITMENTEFCCAYCLYKGPLTDFQIRIKRGYSEKRFKCPECNQGMMRDTLIRKLTPSEYAEFMWNSQSWGRVSWNVWKKRLYEYGWAGEFWAKYRQLKEEFAEEETYDEHLQRKQQEAYDEWVDQHGDE